MTRNARSARIIAAVACALGGWSCDSVVAPPAALPASALDSGLLAARREVAVQILSRAELPIRYVIVERRFYEQYGSKLCFGADECGLALTPGDSSTIPLLYVSGYQFDSQQLYVQWWSPTDPLRQPGDAAPVRRVVVSLAH